MRKAVLLPLCLFLLSACIPATPVPATAPPTNPPPTQQPAAAQPSATETAQPSATPQSSADDFAFAQNRRLGRGVNLGNALEAPQEGQWGVMLQENYYKIIKEGGFNSIRVPIRWNAHAAEKEPFTIDPAFFERVDWVVKNAEQQDLAVIIDFHNYLELMDKPAENKQRFLAIWAQIAKHYRDAPDSVFFEVLNEPNGAIASTKIWNQIQNEAIRTIRATNPGRTIIVGAGNWNAVTNLHELQLPQDDRNLIVTFHYYLPFQFTHQGAEWVEGSDPWLGTTWTETFSQKHSVKIDLNLAKAYEKKNQRPIFLGEFGAYSKAGMDSRSRWTAFVSRSAEERGFSWAYWEFCAGFGVYDPVLKQWVDPIHKALIPEE